jgi:hypothetical protein
MKFELVNPYSDNKRIAAKSSNSDEAAFSIWNTLNNYTKGHVNNTFFTIQSGGSGGKLYHYKVNEKLENNKVNFTLSQCGDKDIKNEPGFVKFLSNQTGGKHKSYSSSSSSSSDSDLSDDLVFKFKSKNKEKYLKNEPFIAYPSSYYVNTLNYCPWLYYCVDPIIIPTYKSTFTSNVAIIPVYGYSKTKDWDFVLYGVP